MPIAVLALLCILALLGCSVKVFGKSLNLILVAAIGLFVAVGCGKSQGDFQGLNSPYMAAPGFPGGYTALPASGYPANPVYGGFNPQLPVGYPADYTLFLPVDYFMRTNPQTAPFWPGYWNAWASYAYLRGWSVYDFKHFWYDYTAIQWSKGAWNQIYRYLDRNFYAWLNPYVVYATPVNPQAFWVNYSGYGYGNSWNFFY